MVTADFNHDGKPDIAILDTGAAWRLVYRGNGDGTFQTGKAYSLTGLAFSASGAPMATGNFNADGKLDVAIAMAGDIGIFSSDGNGGSVGRSRPVMPTDRSADSSLTAGATRNFTVAIELLRNSNHGAGLLVEYDCCPAGSVGISDHLATGQSQPLVSALNALQGQIAANAAIVPAGSGGPQRSRPGTKAGMGSSDTGRLLVKSNQFQPSS